jgi:hypothetical protein
VPWPLAGRLLLCTSVVPPILLLQPTRPLTMRRLWSSRIELFERCLFAVFGLWFFVTLAPWLIFALQSSEPGRRLLAQAAGIPHQGEALMWCWCIAFGGVLVFMADSGDIVVLVHCEDEEEWILWALVRQEPQPRFSPAGPPLYPAGLAGLRLPPTREQRAGPRDPN